MKKIIIFLLSLIMVLTIFCGCTQLDDHLSILPPDNKDAEGVQEKPIPTYEVFEVGNYDYALIAAHTSEMELFEYKQFEDSAKLGSKKSFVLRDGETVEGMYFASRESSFYNRTVDEYIVQTEDGVIMIHWNLDLNQVTHYNRSVFNAEYDSSLPQKSKDECIAIAKDFLKTLTEEEDAYEVVGVRYFDSNSSEMQPYYYISFERKIGMFRTLDAITISVETDGELTHYGYMGFGTLDGVEAPTEEVLTLVQGKMETKFSTIYGACSEKYTVEHEWKDWKLVRMQNGKLAIIKTISVTLTEKAVETTAPVHETVELLVYLEA